MKVRDIIKRSIAALNTLAGSRWQPASIGLFGGASYNDAGVTVNELTAMSASAVWCATQVISNTIGCLPFEVIHRKTGQVQTGHPVHQLFNGRPNEAQTPIGFKECMMVQALLWGHAEAYVQKDGRNRPTALYPLRSAVTCPVKNTPDAPVLYRTIVGTETRYFRPDEVLSIVWATIDGYSPVSPIQQARQTIGLSLALERYAALFFGQGGNAGGILKLPPGMTEEAIGDFARHWRELYTGADNAWRMAVLPEGFDYKPTMVDPRNAQALEARVHQIREVARIFRVPPHKLMDLERATFSNIEQQSIEFTQDTIAPWATRWEQEANVKLLASSEKDLTCRFNLDALLRGDRLARYQAHAQGIQAGFLTVNEARAKENKPPVPGGDEVLRPLNMAPASKAP